MYDNWTLIYCTPHLHEVEIIKSIFSDNNIETVTMNKLDSAYHFGEIEIYVPTDDAFTAKQLIPEFSE